MEVRESRSQTIGNPGESQQIRHLVLLACFPRIGRAVDEISPGFRRFRFQAHTVFYTEERDFVLIRAVLHQAREIKSDLFD